MTVNLSALAGAGAQFLDNNGVILSGGKLYSYAAGTTTPQATYTGITGSTPHTNPIILNSAGRVATGEIWLTAGENYKFSLFTSADILIATWDNITGINGTGITSNAVNVKYDPAGAGAVATTVQAKLRESVSVKDFGAVGDGFTDDTAAFTAAGSIAARVQVYVPAGVYELNSNPTPTGFVTFDIQQGASFTGAGRLPVSETKGSILAAAKTYKSIENDSTFYSGIFKYLENNSALTGYGVIGLHGSVQTSNSAGAGARLGIASFGVNDYVGGTTGLWGLYSTVVRESGATGATHGIELDVANLGTTAPLFPFDLFSAGQTHGAWIASGGEISETVDAPLLGTVSLAIGILSNDPNHQANFDKGIVFHRYALSGTDGLSGKGIAVAMATHQALAWYSSGNTNVAEIFSTNQSPTDANRLRIDFSEFGLSVARLVDGNVFFNISAVANAVNRIQINPSITGSPVAVLAAGSDTDIDLSLTAKGTGTLRFGTFTANADAPINGYITIKDAGGATRKLATIA